MSKVGIILKVNYCLNDGTFLMFSNLQPAISKEKGLTACEMLQAGVAKTGLTYKPI